MQSRLMAVALTIARIELGRDIHEVGGSNRGLNVEKYQYDTGYDPGDAWCACFTHWCVDEACSILGLPNPLVRTGRVKTMWDGAVNKLKIDIPDKSLVKPGAIWCQVRGNGTGHTGFVEWHDGHDFYTIEGNYQDKVANVKRSFDDPLLQGFIVY